MKLNENQVNELRSIIDTEIRKGISKIYFQFRDRLQHYKRDKPPICVFLFSNLGLEQKIYKAHQKKKNFTLSYYKKGYCVRV